MPMTPDEIKALREAAEQVIESRSEYDHNACLLARFVLDQIGMDGEEKVTAFIDLVDELPAGLRSDWIGTNHYELTSDNPYEYWWLDIPDVFAKADGNWSSTGDGQRLGLIMDIAVAAQDVLPFVKSHAALGIQPREETT